MSMMIVMTVRTSSRVVCCMAALRLVLIRDRVLSLIRISRSVSIVAETGWFSNLKIRVGKLTERTGRHLPVGTHILVSIIATVFVS